MARQWRLRSANGEAPHYQGKYSCRYSVHVRNRGKEYSHRVFEKDTRLGQPSRRPAHHRGDDQDKPQLSKLPAKFTRSF
ncbi:hypothetical protein L1987_23133 [Smallanthus sonchifolius]|uniref:Uncharacterized protein n=1 Tax=Smallanthus sonchifolius TaxID=185202 RepID=A0ACB9IHP1_9ASTR|nr:hypothetical protein L1987_23133 [Smallanthus sonchifolius]